MDGRSAVSFGRRLGADAAARRGSRKWLSAWHSEDDWLRATYTWRYTNGVVGITEELLPMTDALPRRNP